MRRAHFLAGVGASALTQCSPSRGAVLRLDAAPLGHDIDPYRDPEIGIDELAWLYADGLVGWEHRPIPLLAAKLPDRLDGGLRYRYQLRRAIWHDGREVRAQDVAEALDAVRTTPFGTREPYRSIRGLVIDGDHKFDVVLDSLRPGFVRSFFGAYGTPALPLVRRAADGSPIGTGPFAVRGHPETGRWQLERSEHSPRGAPLLGAVELRLLTSDMTANVRLLSGEADIALPLAPAAIGAEHFRRVERVTSTAVFLFNANGVFHSAALRRAFAGAVDVAALQRTFDRRRRELLATLVLGTENDPGFEKLLKRDPSAAPVLRDGMRGANVTIAYVRPSPAHERTAILLQQLLREAGVESTLRPAAGFAYQGADGPLRTGRFDIAIAGFVYGDEPDLVADWSCDERPPRGGNFARWCDSSFQRAAAGRDVAGMLRRLYDTVACIPLTRAYEDIGVLANVNGFAAPDPLTPVTYGCTKWRFSEAVSSSARASTERWTFHP